MELEKIIDLKNEIEGHKFEMEYCQRKIDKFNSKIKSYMCKMEEHNNIIMELDKELSKYKIIRVD